MMKKYILTLMALIATMSINAQTIEVYKNGGEEPVATYYNINPKNKYKVVLEDYTFVDLDLPSQKLWATCNVGATAPEEYGNYYAWGEVTPQTDNAYSWAKYKHANGASDKLTKYCYKTTYGDNGFKDDVRYLQAEDDAATANWGVNCFMPSDEDWKELKERCEWKWTDHYQNTNVAGYIVSNNRNSIFFPAAGGYVEGQLQCKGERGFYWSKSLYTSKSSNAWFEVFGEGENYVSYTDRCNGFTIRPVRYKKIDK